MGRHHQCNRSSACRCGICVPICSLWHAYRPSKSYRKFRQLHDWAVEQEALGNFDRAQHLLLEEKHVLEEEYGRNHPWFAQGVGQLAKVYNAKGQLQQAEALILSQQEILAKTVGEKHPDMAEALTNLGVVYFNLGNYAKAEEQDLQALQVWEVIAGTGSMQYAVTFGNLAETYMKGGRSSLQKCMEAVRRAKDVFGEGSPYYAEILRYLADLHQNLKNQTDAEKLYEKVKHIQAQILGTEHPDYADTLHNFALLHERMHNFGKAKQYFQQARVIREARLGPNHPNTRDTVYQMRQLQDIATTLPREAPAPVRFESPAAQTFGEALVFGVSEYVNSEHNALPGAWTDAKRMEQALFNMGFKVELVMDPTHERLTGHIKSFIDRVKSKVESLYSSPGDVLICFYVACHGYESTRSDLPILIPSDSKGRGDSSQHVALDDILIKPLNRIRFPGGKLSILLIFDTCRENFQNSTWRGLAEEQPPLEKEDRSPSSQEIRQSLRDRVFASAHDFLLLLSCDPGRTIAENEEGGTLTRCLVRKFDMKGIDLHTACSQAAQDVARSTNNKQRPWIHHRGDFGKFWLN